MRWASCILCLFCLLIGRGAFAQSPSSDSLRFVVLGSSTASATGASVPDSGWVRRYADFLKSKYPASSLINLAVGGYTTYHIQPNNFRAPANRPDPDTARNISAALALRPSGIIVNLPSNDAARKFPVEERLRNFIRVMNRAIRANVPLWICTPQPRNMSAPARQELRALRDWILEVFHEEALDFWSVLDAGDGSILPEFDSGDGIHLNDAGHRALFSVVMDAQLPMLSRFLRSQKAPGPTNRTTLQVLPEATHSFAVFRIETIHSGGYTITVRDLFGKEISRVNGRSVPGVTLRFYNAENLRPGIYPAVLQNGKTIASDRLVIVR